MSDYTNEELYQRLLVKMKAEYHNSEVIQCFVKTEINRALHEDINYEDIKAFVSMIKKEIESKNNKN